MRSITADRRPAARPAPPPAVRLAAACLAAAVVHGAWAQDALPRVPLAIASAPAAESAPPRDPVGAKVVAEVERLRRDPELAGTHKERHLRWTGRGWHLDWQPRESTPDLGWLEWLRSFVLFINDTSRLLLYALVAGVVAVLAVVGYRFASLRGFGGRGRRPDFVSHVGELDVRPESLPDDIAAAAWALWQAGRVQAALSLLYRGALSRLIHRHAVPISSSSTEGECLALARPHLDPAALRYLTQLVRAWEAGTYGRRELSAAMGESLCTGFASRLDAAAPAAPGAER
jgi:hypothetical protein